jgi:WhiB family transcriptional regulator, redox-sensing transcriptional regulator
MSLDEWVGRAACRGSDPTLWFGRVDDMPPARALDAEAAGPEKRRIEKARAYCEGCPVRLECLDHALSLPEAYGIWGGTTRRQRSGYRNQLHSRRPGAAREFSWSS